nr:hypothetical protein Iba_chr07cCG5510 [Ipomoea batatas]
MRAATWSVYCPRCTLGLQLLPWIVPKSIRGLLAHLHNTIHELIIESHFRSSPFPHQLSANLPHPPHKSKPQTPHPSTVAATTAVANRSAPATAAIASLRLSLRSSVLRFNTGCMLRFSIPSLRSDGSLCDATCLKTRLRQQWGHGRRVFVFFTVVFLVTSRDGGVQRLLHGDVSSSDESSSALNRLLNPG